jgi:peroxiredoxin
VFRPVGAKIKVLTSLNSMKMRARFERRSALVGVVVGLFLRFYSAAAVSNPPEAASVQAIAESSAGPATNGGPGPLPQLGVEMPNFNLLDLRGHNHELQRAGGRAVVLFFTGTGCPIARKSAPKLRDLQDHFGKDGVSFWIINSYADDTFEEIHKECDELGLWRLTYLRDTKQNVALAFNVHRTAEVVALSTKDWHVVYRGAIDDQFGEGAERATPQNHFLEQALGEFLADKPVVVPFTKARGCLFTFAGPNEVPSYTQQVAPLLRQHCVDCHRADGIGSWSMSGHARVKQYGRMIEEVLLTRRMPPWDANPNFGKFANAHVLTTGETQTLLRWVEAGAPNDGGPDPLADPLPPLPDWPLGKPDVVMRLPEIQQIPATGVLEYRYLHMPSPFTNEVWIVGTDIKPGNRQVVHHVILYAKWPNCPDDGTGNGVHLCGWAPGLPPARFPIGVGKRLPAGAELTAEVHYTTCGSAQTDQSEIAFYLAAGPQPRVAEIRRAIQVDVDIPPGSDEARHAATYGFSEPATIYSLMPHMHFRGKWMRYELLLPDGKKETLLQVPRYDFNWQLDYQLAEPRHVPAGAWLLVTGAFDNSPENPANPNARTRVHFGRQSWDEMFIGFFEAANDPAPAPQVLTPTTPAR